MESNTLEISLDDDLGKNKTQYFFSLLGPRFDVMNKLMASSLKKKFGGEFKPIRVLPARPNKHYDYGNYIVMNEHAKQVEDELGDKIIYLQEYEDLNVEFFDSPLIKDLSDQLLKKQDQIFIYSFTTSFMKRAKGFTPIGPDPELATYYDDKIKHYELFSELDLPRNEVRIFSDLQDLLRNYKEFMPSYLTATYTSGGNEAGLIYDGLCLNKFIGGLRDINKEKGKFLAAKIFERSTWEPNVNAIVTGEGETSVLVITDQIMSGNRYLGNIYPSTTPKKVHEEIVEITTKVGNYISKKGYRGLFGLDFLVNDKGRLVVVDFNPRRQGGYLCNALALKESGVELTDLELECALEEDINKMPKYEDITYPGAWTYSKIRPSDPGRRVVKEINDGNMEDIFKKRGVFESTFYREGTLFVAGYIGSAAVVGEDRKSIVNKLREITNTTLENSLL